MVNVHFSIDVNYHEKPFFFIGVNGRMNVYVINIVKVVCN